MQIQSEHLIQMTEDLFASMLDMTVTTVQQERSKPEPTALQASVCVSGEWCAELRVIASQQLAEAIACSMFAMKVSELTDEERHDALGEIANVIGGNLKGIVDRDCDLSIPCVGDVFDEVPTVGLYQAFQCADDVLHIYLIEQ